MANKNEYDYTKIDKPYDNFLNRQEDTSKIGVYDKIKVGSDVSASGNANKGGNGEITSGQQIQNIWIDKWIKSTGYLPKKHGFWLDAINGVGYFTNVDVSGGYIKGANFETVAEGTLGKIDISGNEINLYEDTLDSTVPTGDSASINIIRANSQNQKFVIKGRKMGTNPDGNVVEMYFNAPSVHKTNILGDSTTSFDITTYQDPGDGIYRIKFTWNGIGSNPNILNVISDTGLRIIINAQEFNISNNGVYYITDIDTNYFTVYDEFQNGVAESGKKIGTGSITVDTFSHNLLYFGGTGWTNDRYTDVLYGAFGNTITFSAGTTAQNSETNIAILDAYSPIMLNKRQPGTVSMYLFGDCSDREEEFTQGGGEINIGLYKGTGVSRWVDSYIIIDYNYVWLYGKDILPYTSADETTFIIPKSNLGGMTNSFSTLYVKFLDRWEGVNRVPIYTITDFYPSVNGTISLGDSTHGWKYIYTRSLFAPSGYSAIVIGSSLLPNTNGTLSLGNSSYGWKELYLGDGGARIAWNGLAMSISTDITIGGSIRCSGNVYTGSLSGGSIGAVYAQRFETVSSTMVIKSATTVLTENKTQIDKSSATAMTYSLEVSNNTGDGGVLANYYDEYSEITEIEEIDQKYQLDNHRELHKTAKNKVLKDTDKFISKLENPWDIKRHDGKLKERQDLMRKKNHDLKIDQIVTMKRVCKLLPGTVLAIGENGAIPTSKEYQTNILGVISDDPGLTSGIERQGVHVTKMGKTKAFVMGKCEPGDLLVSSNEEGCLMKAEKVITGTIVGRARETINSNIKKLIDIEMCLM
jgi:hypothetical protein